MYYLREALGLAAICAMTWAGWSALRLARADAAFRQQTPEGVARALELAPENTAYLSLRALQIEYEGGDSRGLLERWAAANPMASAPRIRLGLDAEVRGDYAAAEKWLLDAARVDRQFEPSWTLANFYFRQQRLPEFWKWMRLALDVSYGDRRPAFDLCRRAGEPQEILRALPDRREVWSAYLEYLLAHHEPADAAGAARKLAEWRDPADRDVLYRACDALLEAGDTQAAMQIWSMLGQATKPAIFHPDFEPPRIGHGFDWHLIESPGVTHLPLDSPPAHRILLSGQQPEACELLKQYVALELGRAADAAPARRYVLRWESRTSGLHSPTGIEWRIGGERAALPASDDWSRGEMQMSKGGWLALEYQRPTGEVRAEGYVEIRHVTVTAQ